MTSADFLNLLNHTPVAIILADENDMIVFTNETIKNMFGIDYQTSEDLSVKKFFSKYTLKWDNIKEKIQQKGYCHFDSSAKKSNGGTIEVSVFCKPFVFGNNPATVCYIRDVSDQQIMIREHFKELQFRQSLLDSIPALIFVKDTENKIIAMNRAFQENAGLNLEMMLGKQISEIISNKELAEQFYKDDLEVINTRLPKRNIIEPLLNDPKRWYITDKIPYTTIDNEILGVIGFSTEITDRKNAEDKLIASEKKFALLYDTAPVGVILSSLDGQIISTNQTFENMIGYSEEELSKMSFYDLIDETDKEKELPTLNFSILFGDTITSVERNYVRKDRTIMPVSVKGWIIKDESGIPVQMGAFVEDITLKKSAEKVESILIDREKEELERDFEQIAKDLNSKIAQLIEKEGIISEVEKELVIILEEQPEDTYDRISEIINVLNQKNSEDFWNQFELTYRQVNKSFYENLYQRFPNLSNNEKKISAFLRMNMSTKEISNITHQSVRSIEMARTRLRTKLHLTRKENLAAFLSQF